MLTEVMRIVVIIAGTNDPSNGDFLADRFVEGMKSGGGAVEVTKVRLRNLHIDHFDVSHYWPDADQGSDFNSIQRLIEEAHGLVIATPVWNFSVPAHLKNLIDRMGSFALDATRSKGALKGKPFFLIFTGGSPLAGWPPLMRRTTSHVPEALRYFGASYIGHHFEGKCTASQGKFRLVVDRRPESIAAVREKGRAFAKVVAGYERTGKAPVRQRARANVMKLVEDILKKVF